MALHAPIGNLRDWVFYRLAANYWSLPLVAIILAPLLALAAISADREGLTDWLVARNLVPVASGDTAQDLAITLIGINAAFIALYLSSVLIVLTLATGNLGVRLVDRWLDKGMVRISMAGLAFCLVHAIVVLMAIDPARPVSAQPVGAIWMMFALQLINVAMLGVAAHDLGRTMFVDRSIAVLGADAADGGIRITAGEPYSGAWQCEITANSEGYVQGIALANLRKRLANCGIVRFEAAPGQHVLCGEVIMRCQHAPPHPQKIARHIVIGDFRTNAQNTVFQARLLVEIAARALSPGINDFYTAISCADRLTCAMAGQADTWVDSGKVALFAEHESFELPGQDFEGLFGDPLRSLRQSAADYPAVAIRMIDNFARLIALSDDPGLHAFLRQEGKDLAEHAMLKAAFAKDRDAIARRRDMLLGPHPCTT